MFRWFPSFLIFTWNIVYGVFHPLYSVLFFFCFSAQEIIFYVFGFFPCLLFLSVVVMSCFRVIKGKVTESAPLLYKSRS